MLWRSCSQYLIAPWLFLGELKELTVVMVVTVDLFKDWRESSKSLGQTRHNGPKLVKTPESGIITECMLSDLIPSHSWQSPSSSRVVYIRISSDSSSSSSESYPSRGSYTQVTVLWTSLVHSFPPLTSSVPVDPCQTDPPSWSLPGPVPPPVEIHLSRTWHTSSTFIRPHCPSQF